MHQMITSRFFDIFSQLRLISIDGMKREKHLLRIADLTADIISDQEELQKSEKAVEEV